MITRPEESFCLMSTEARLLIRNGDRGRKRKKERKLDCAPQTGRPRRPWTAARTIEVLRLCPLAIAQQPVYYAIIAV